MKKCIDAGATSPVVPQPAIVLENSPSNSSYSTVVSALKTGYVNVVLRGHVLAKGDT